jgi:hypothetical protein
MVPGYSSPTGLLNTTMMLAAIIVLSVIGLALYSMLEMAREIGYLLENIGIVDGGDGDEQ